MDRGYVKLWRKSLESVFFGNPNVWLFWCYCLMKASHKKRKSMVGNQVIYLQPGQFIFGRKKAAQETGLTEQNIRSCLQLLKTNQQITIKPTNKFSIITVINWETYQPTETTTNQQITNNQPTDNQQITTDKNVEKLENVLGKFKKSVLMPEKYQIQKEHIEYARTKGLDENQAKDQFEVFKIHHQAKGTKFKNWYAAYQKWIRNSIEFGKVDINNKTRKIKTLEEREKEEQEIFKYG